FVFHQANERIIDSAAAKLQLDKEKCFKNISDYGNTSAASIAIALGEMQEKNLLHPGMKIVCVGFGAGLTYGAIATEL
ncbi:MAG: 3-oxoacyl-[acyl-carrier-protein] synthase III C-terminal domain-containing protein, partial [Eubacterium sp.]